MVQTVESISESPEREDPRCKDKVGAKAPSECLQRILKDPQNVAASACLLNGDWPGRFHAVVPGFVPFFAQAGSSEICAEPNPCTTGSLEQSARWPEGSAHKNAVADGTIRFLVCFKGRIFSFLVESLAWQLWALVLA